IIFGWLGLFLIIGLIESYIAFSRLAHGRRARRGLPIAFAGMFPLLSCFFLCCHQRGFQAKTPAEQETLTAEWKAMGFFTKLGRWLKWGFRYKYPTFLGTPPLRRKRWQDKDTPAGANVPIAQQQMMGPQGPLPPPGSMYVVGAPPPVAGADAAQRGSVYQGERVPAAGVVRAAAAGREWEPRAVSVWVPAAGVSAAVAAGAGACAGSRGGRPGGYPRGDSAELATRPREPAAADEAGGSASHPLRGGEPRPIDR
ncbi:hypothetical protein V498_06062, partial [Pseudogymnoascus sp. VKM F-4517 (FW-2822)]